MGEDFGKLILRLTVGGLLLLHGVHKLLGGIEPIKHMLAAHGAPDMLAYGVYAGEIAAPVLLIIGLASRLGAGLIVINMIVAALLAGGGRLLALDGQTGGYAMELEAFYLLGALAVMFLGAGRLSVGGTDGQLN